MGFYGTASTADRADGSLQTVSSSNSSKPQQSAAPKRKVRSKGSIKKKTAKPMGSGYSGFGSRSSAESSSGGSAFGFMNEAASSRNVAAFGNGGSLKAESQPMFSRNTANDDMFGGMQ